MLKIKRSESITSFASPHGDISIIWVGSMTQRNYFLSCPCFSLLEIQWYFFPCASFCVIEDNDAEEVSDNGIRSPDWELPALFCVPE